MIMYFGNILSRHGYNRTTIEELGPKLNEICDISLYSQKKIVILETGYKLYFPSKIEFIDLIKN